MGKDNSCHSVAQGKDSTEGQDDHAADTVPDQDGWLSTQCLQHGVQIGRELFEAEVPVGGRFGSAESGLIPDDQAKLLAQLAVRVGPFVAIEAPAVREEQRRPLRQTVRSDKYRMTMR